MVIVSKYGGTSTADGQSLERVINIILAGPERRVIVPSAPGKRSQTDEKVTDLLIQLGTNVYNEFDRTNEQPYIFRTELHDIQRRFIDITDYFGMESSFLNPQFKSLVTAINRFTIFDEPRRPEVIITIPDDYLAYYLDKIKPFGEIIVSEIIAEVLRRRGINAQVYRPEEIGMITDGNFGNAKLVDASYKKIAKALKPVLQGTDEIIVVPGFYGVDKDGRFTTFPRGGSGLTGAILANALDAQLYENWTDIDGIRRVDPRIVDNPDIIRRLTYREARELAYSGAEILHPDALIPLIAKGIPLNVRNTFNPNHEGTYITATRDIGNVVEGIAHKNGFTTIYIEKIGMNEQIGYLNRLTEVFARHGVSIDQMTTSIDSVSIAVATNGNNGKINAVRDDIIKEGLADTGGVKVDYDKAMVCVVGEGMREPPGIVGNLSHELESNGINIETIYKGSSERNIIFGLAQKDAVRAVQLIYSYCMHLPRS